MYAAAGGASLASRQARRNIKKQQHPGDVHQQFKRRFELLQAQHAPATSEIHRLHQHSSYLELQHARIPALSTADITEVGGPSVAAGQGKAAAAWADRERRASEAVGHRHLRHGDTHRRWISRNRIHDSSYGGSSSEEEEVPGLYGHQSAAANALLYVGLGTVAIGLVIAFVGTGEKGFKTLELRLIGPTLIAGGLLCCLLRIFLCVCPTRCLKRKFKRRKKRHISAELNRHFDKNEYYRHLPFNARTAEDFMLMENTNKKTKKRVSILPAGPSTSDRRDIPKILLPKDKTPVKEGNLIELKPIQGGSFEDLPSISSEDSFQLDQSLALFESGDGGGKGNSQSSERLARLKSTLTFGDSLDAPDFNARDHTVSRIDEEDSEATDMYSSHQGALNSPLLFQHNDADDGKELVLCPSNLNNSSSKE